MLKTAGKTQKILIEDDEGTLKIEPNHEYHYQMLIENFLTVHEQLVPFRASCSFIQYIPSKPVKYGLKLF